MDREGEEPVALIDLGVATAETQGAEEGDFDMVGLMPRPALSQD